MQAVGRQPRPASRAPDGALVHYEGHRPQQTTLYRLVQQHAATFFEQAESATGADLPKVVKDEFDALLECGILAHGFLRLRCGDCGHDKLVAFICKRRGFCPSCGARRMAQTAAHLVDHVIPHVPVRQWVLALPIPLRLLLTAQPKLVTPVTKAFDVVHLAGHSATDWMPKAGNPDGAKQSPLSGVVIGAAAVLSAQDLLLQDTPPYLVTLGSDFLGGWGPTLRQGGVQVVVSCQRGMHDEPAHHFFDAFYAALCAGRAVGHALQEARHAALRCNNDGLIAAANMLCHGNPDYGWTITPPTEPPPAAARRSARKSISKSASESASTTARKNASR